MEFEIEFRSWGARFWGWGFGDPWFGSTLLFARHLVILLLGFRIGHGVVEK